MPLRDSQVKREGEIFAELKLRVSNSY